MIGIRKWKSLFAWLAMVATLAAALLPSVSHAIASGRIDNIMLAEICAPSGKSYATMTGDDGQQAGHMDDCPYCRLASDLPVLPGTAQSIAPALAAAALPPLFYLSPSPLFAWTAAKPRGPPSPV